MYHNWEIKFTVEEQGYFSLKGIRNFEIKILCCIQERKEKIKKRDYVDDSTMKLGHIIGRIKRWICLYALLKDG